MKMNFQFGKLKNFIRGVYSARVLLVVGMLLFATAMFAQDAAAGKGAIDEVVRSLGSYIPSVQKLLYVIAAIVGLGGVATIFIKMNNEEQDIKKTIMLVIGSCVALIALAEAVPMFFGY